MPTSPAPYSVLPNGAGDPYTPPVAVHQRGLLPVASRLRSRDPVGVDRCFVAAGQQPAEPGPSKVWRTTSALGQYVDIVLRSALACNAVAMAGFNMSSAGVWRLKAYASAEGHWSNAGLRQWLAERLAERRAAFGSRLGLETALLQVANDAAYRYWRVEFADPSVGMTYIDVGRLAIGRAVQFSLNFNFDVGIAFAPNDTQEPNGWGQIFTDPRPVNRAFSMTWSALGQLEVNNVAMELVRLRGMAGDVFCFLDPGEIALFHKWSMQACSPGAPTSSRCLSG